MLLISTFLLLHLIYNPLLDIKKKLFFDFLPQTNRDSFFFSVTDCNEVSNIIFSLINHKTVGPNSIPTKNTNNLFQY